MRILETDYIGGHLLAWNPVGISIFQIAHLSGSQKNDYFQVYGRQGLVYMCCFNEIQEARPVVTGLQLNADARIIRPDGNIETSIEDMCAAGLPEVHATYNWEVWRIPLVANAKKVSSELYAQHYLDDLNS